LELNDLVKFGTVEYYNQIADFLNKDETFSKSNLSTTFAFIFSDLQKAILLNIEGGKITNVSDASPDVATEFSSTGTYDILAGIAKGELNQFKAKAKVNMVKALKNRAALERISEAMKQAKDVNY
jgi:putative sterol carrier protein